MDVNERLNKFIEDKGMTVKEFAELIGMKYESFHPYTITDKQNKKKYQRRPGIQTLEKLSKVGCDLNWLILGKKMNTNIELENKINEINKILKKYDIQSLEDLEDRLKSFKQVQKIIKI